MPWKVRAVQLPDGDEPDELWIDAAGCLATEPVPEAELLPGRYMLPGLVDAHAHPAVGRLPGIGMPVALGDAEARQVLAEWAAAGVCLVRDTGSPGGRVLRLDRAPGLPRLQAAGRFLAPAGRYFPALLPEAAPEDRLTELALAELARGGRWVKVISDFPPVVDGMPAGPASQTYSLAALTAMVAAVHGAGGRVAAHVTTDFVADVLRAGVDSIEHGRAIDEPALRSMAATGTAWTPTLSATFALAESAPPAVWQRVAEYREQLRELLPLAHRLGVPILAGTDTAGTVAGEIALLAEHGLDPAAALAAATTAAYSFLGEPFDQAGRPTTLVTYRDDPRNDLAILAAPAAVIIDGVRVR